MSLKTFEIFNRITVSSLKDQENTNLGSPMKKGAGNPSRSADPCNNMQAVDSKRKRRADDDGQMPSKKMRSSNPINPTEQPQVSVEDKGEANVDTRPPEKKTRSGVNTSEPKAASGKNSQLRSGKRKANNDGEQPKKRERCGDQTNKPETSPEVKKETRQEQKLSSCTGKTSRADFQQKYLELETIGKGGFGSVFAGVRRADGLPVAIKHIPSKDVLRQQVTRNGTKQNVYLEVDFMIATAGHPETVGQSAAVTLLDWYILGEEIILVMERPQNAMDLLKYLKTREGSLDEDEAKMILKQLVDAFIDIHAKGVFHRDIKLQNVLIHAGSNGPRVRVIDFGCGAFTTEKSFHSFSGTFAIAPPEWFEKRKYWARSTTVWQLGVLFYSLLRGHQCFITKAFMKKDIQINQALSRGVKTLLEKCLAINPEERATLQDLQRSLALQ